MTPRQRTERAAALTVLAHSFALADIRAQHPHESAQEHRYRLAVRLYGESFMQRVTSKSRDCVLARKDLDVTYLGDTAKEAGLSELLARALREA